jgi:hypothetical protein
MGKPRGVGNEGKRRIFVAERAKGRTIKEAAEKAGLSEGQGERLSADPQVKARVERLLEEMTDEDRRARLEARRDASRAAKFALRRLIDLAQGSGGPAVQAGKALLEHDRQLWPTQIEVEVSAPSVSEEKPLTIRDIFTIEGDPGSLESEWAEEAVIDRARAFYTADLGQLSEPEQEPPRLRVVESEVSDPVPVADEPARVNDGLTDLERSELKRHRLYREGVPASVQREVLKRAGFG